MIYNNVMFVDKRVEMAGHQFYNCTFEGAVVAFDGSAPFDAVGCSFNECQFLLTGAAGLAVDAFERLGVGKWVKADRT